MKFIDNTKTAFKKNKIAKFLTISGGVAAVVDTFSTLPLVHSLEIIGQGAGGLILNEALKGNEKMADKSNGQLVGHAIKSSFLVLGGATMLVATSILPFGHLTSHVIHTLMVSGVLGLGETAIEKFKRRSESKSITKNEDNLVFSKQSNKKEVDTSNYVGLRNRNNTHSENEVENELSILATYNKTKKRI